jgi:hypothetical protein
MERSHSGDPPNALFHSGRGPRQVEMYDDVGILKVHTLTQQIGRKQQIDSFSYWRRLGVKRAGCKSEQRLIACQPASGDESASSAQHCDATCGCQSGVKHGHSLPVLGERDDPCLRMFRADLAEDFSTLCVERSVGSMALEKTLKRIQVNANGI